MRLERPDRILTVLEEVRGDHEVLASLLELRERLAVVDEIDRHERLASELGVLDTELLCRQAVEVAHPCGGGHWEGAVQCSDLDSASRDHLSRQAAPAAVVEPASRPAGGGERPHLR